MDGQPNESREITGELVVIDDKPSLFWDRDHRQTQLRFLGGIDPEYFAYLGSLHREQLEGPEGAHAAIALRVSYSHGLEALFAMIGASLQAPKCPAAWLTKYTNSSLAKLISKIDKWQDFPAVVQVRGGWEGVAQALVPWRGTDDRFDELRLASEELWSMLARDFLDQALTDEYNGLKHGFRVAPGEWHLNIAVEQSPGVLGASPTWHPLAHNKYGSTFFRPVELRKLQWQFEEQSVGWDPFALAFRLELIGASMHNILELLRSASGSEEGSLKLFTREQVADAREERFNPSNARLQLRTGIDPGALPDVTAAQLLEDYAKRHQRP